LLRQSKGCSHSFEDVGRNRDVARDEPSKRGLFKEISGALKKVLLIDENHDEYRWLYVKEMASVIFSPEAPPDIFKEGDERVVVSPGD
jgi:hypothetical protein